MIDLEMVRQTLVALDEDEKDITQEDILGVYHDLNEAVRLSGSSVSSLPVEDPHKLAEYLSVCGTDFLRITRNNEGILSGEDPTGRIAKRREKIEQRMETLEQQLQKLSEEKEEIEEKERKQKEKEKEVVDQSEKLKADREALTEKERQVNELEAYNNEIQAQIDSIKAKSIVAAEQQKSTLQRELEFQEKALQKVKDECTAISNDIKTKEGENRTASAELKKSEQEAKNLKSQNDQYQRDIEKQENKIKAEESRNSVLLQRHKTANEQNESLKKELSELNEKKALMDELEAENQTLSIELESGEKEADKQCTEIEEKFKKKQEAATAEKDSLTERLAALIVTNKEICGIEEECAQLEKEIEKLTNTSLPAAVQKRTNLTTQRDDLKMSIGKENEDYKKLCDEKGKLDIEKKTIEDAVTSKKEEIALLKKEITGFENSITVDSNTINELKEKREQVKLDSVNLQKQREDLQQKLDVLQEKLKREREKFNSEEVPEHNKKIKSINKKIALIEKLKNEMTKEIKYGVISGDQESDQLAEDLEERIRKFEEDAKEIEKIYNRITQILED